MVLEQNPNTVIEQSDSPPERKAAGDPFSAAYQHLIRYEDPYRRVRDFVASVSAESNKYLGPEDAIKTGERIVVGWVALWDEIGWPEMLEALRDEFDEVRRCYAELKDRTAEDKSASSAAETFRQAVHRFVRRFEKLNPMIAHAHYTDDNFQALPTILFLTSVALMPIVIAAFVTLVFGAKEMSQSGISLILNLATVGTGYVLLFLWGIPFAKYGWPVIQSWTVQNNRRTGLFAAILFLLAGTFGAVALGFAISYGLQQIPTLSDAISENARTSRGQAIWTSAISLSLLAVSLYPVLVGVVAQQVLAKTGAGISAARLLAVSIPLLLGIGSAVTAIVSNS